MLASAAIAVSLAFAACSNKDVPEDDIIVPPDDPIDETDINYNADDFITEFKDKLRQEAVLNTSDLPKTLTFNEGMTITIHPGTFTKDGVPIEGEFKVEFYEMLRPSSMIFSSTNTNYFGYGGNDYFESDGFFYINVSQNGVNVDQRLNMPLEVTIPTAKEDGEWTQLWQGNEDNEEEGVFGWEEVDRNDTGEMSWEIMAKGGSFSFYIGKLGWINCDVQWNIDGNRTTITITITGEFGDLASYLGYTGDTFIFFRAKGMLVLVQIYTKTGDNQVQSYTNSVPVGAKGKLVGYSVKEGKFSYAEKEIEVTEDADYALDLQSVTKDELEANIKALDTYGE